MKVTRVKKGTQRDPIGLSTWFVSVGLKELKGFFKKKKKPGASVYSYINFNKTDSSPKYAY